MAVLMRIFVGLLAIFAGGLTAATVVALAEAALHSSALAPGEFLAAILLSLMAAANLFPLALAGAAIAEYWRLRAPLFHVAAGALVPLASVVVSGRALSYLADDQRLRHLAVVLPAGAAAGLAYWAIAGRKAGAWRDEKPRYSPYFLAFALGSAGLGVLVAPTAIGLYGLAYPPDTEAAWDSKVGWRLCNGAIADWPAKPAPACARLIMCDNEGGLTAFEQTRLKQMMAATHCED